MKEKRVADNEDSLPRIDPRSRLIALEALLSNEKKRETSSFERIEGVNFRRDASNCCSTKVVVYVLC